MEYWLFTFRSWPRYLSFRFNLRRLSLPSQISPRLFQAQLKSLTWKWTVIAFRQSMVSIKWGRRVIAALRGRNALFISWLSVWSKIRSNFVCSRSTPLKILVVCSDAQRNPIVHCRDLTNGQPPGHRHTWSIAFPARFWNHFHPNFTCIHNWILSKSIRIYKKQKYVHRYKKQ